MNDHERITRYNRIKSIRRRLKRSNRDPLDVAAEAMYENEQLEYELEAAEEEIEHLLADLEDL